MIRSPLNLKQNSGFVKENEDISTFNVTRTLAVLRFKKLIVLINIMFEIQVKKFRHHGTHCKHILHVLVSKGEIKCTIIYHFSPLRTQVVAWELRLHQTPEYKYTKLH